MKNVLILRQIWDFKGGVGLKIGWEKSVRPKAEAGVRAYLFFPTLFHTKQCYSFYCTVFY